MSMVEVRDALAMMHAGQAMLAAASMDPLTKGELLEVGDELMILNRQLPTQDHRWLARLQVQTTPRELGAKSWRDVLAIRWRMSTFEAHRRLTDAAALGPRRSLTGQALPPELPATAAAQASGLINAEHVTVIRTAIKKLPGFVDAPTRAQIEVDWVRLAVGVGPKPLAEATELTLFLLDQDGPEPDDTERARKRGLSTGTQGRDATIPIHGQLTPEAWATWEPIFAKYAAPGMCNPDDPEPCTSGTPSQAQIDNDHRSIAQRRHDAFVAVGRIALMSGQLGKLNGLPVAIIIRTTLHDLESRAGIGTTGGGTTMPIADVIRLGGHANHHLAVFDKATGSALDLFRTQRIASPAQRITLIARDGGCTKPCCTVGAYGSQVHHARRDWADDGNTNVDDLGLACGPDNRMVGPDQWTTTINAHGEVEWIPPPHLDTGQARINYHHRPEGLLRPPDEPVESQGDDDTVAPPPPEPIRDDGCQERNPLDPWARVNADHTVESPAPGPTGHDGCPEPEPEPLDPWGHDDADESGEPAPPEPIRVGGCDEPEPFDPWARDTPAEPGGPAPPDDRAA